METSLLTPEFWASSQSHVLLSPAIEISHGERLRNAMAVAPAENVIWLQSSGTESHRAGSLKFVAVPKEGLLVAAASVTKFFNVDSEDCWLQPLPNFHIGGLSVYARGHVSGCRVIDMGFPQKWAVPFFLKRLQETKATIVSLVPTQVYDLVEEQAKAPSWLRLAVIGGGRLAPSILKRARRLGWPVLPSYGMTETSALMASCPLSDLQSEDVSSEGFMQILPHITARLDKKKRLLLEGESLATGYLFLSDKESVFKQIDRPFVSDDRVEFKDGQIRVLSRNSELVKVLGESVNLVELSLKLSQTFPESREACILPVADERRGFRLIGFLEAAPRMQDKGTFNAGVAPFETIEELVVLEHFPRTALGKIKKAELLSLQRPSDGLPRT